MNTCATCKHTWTQGREGENGYWCVACGFKRLEVHAQPCSACLHYRTDFSGAYCKKQLMAVVPNMHVTYTCFDDGTNDLCFEDRDSVKENAQGESR